MTDHLSFNFNKATALPDTDFARALGSHFDAQTTAAVHELFERLHLPTPENNSEFLRATQGCLVFLNPYGVVLRIESAIAGDSKRGAIRINDSGHVLQPIASIHVGDAVLEICPGCRKEEDAMAVDRLYNSLVQEKINYWDSEIANNGRLPVATPSFPDGVPVVIDRLSVRPLHDSVQEVAEAVKKASQEAKEAQAALYAPLQNAFQTAWNDPSQMDEFWELCACHVDAGKLVAGWTQELPQDDMKPMRAHDSARSYGARLMKW